MKQLSKDQRGIASLLFTMIMMVVISLIVLSFAQVARRGQRVALDSQLSTQAYYAAESGINDGIVALKALAASPTGDIPSNDSCQLSPTYQGALASGASSTLSSQNNVRYTCLRINTTPATLAVSDLTPGRSEIIYLEPTSGSPPLSQLTIKWKPKDARAEPSKDCPNSSARDRSFSPADTWDTKCGYSVLRFDLVPTTGTVTMGVLQSRTMSVFAVPTTNAAAGSESSVSYGAVNAAKQGQYGTAHCDDEECTLVITNLPGAANYALRMMSIYSVVPEVQISGGAGLRWKNGQAVIDSTGQAQDVMRRVQVRVPLTSMGGHYSDYAITTKDSLCKRYAISATESPSDDTSCPGLTRATGGAPGGPSGGAGGTCGFAGCDGISGGTGVVRN